MSKTRRAACGRPRRLHPSLVHHVANTLGWAALRPLQAEAVGPLLAGDDALLLAPTAGGKTEAAVFPAAVADDRRRLGGTVGGLPGAAEGAC